MAERVGFEPTLPCGKHAFQACAFSHSAISPALRGQPFDFTSVEAPAQLFQQCTASDVMAGVSAGENNESEVDADPDGRRCMFGAGGSGRPGFGTSGGQSRTPASPPSLLSPPLSPLPLDGGKLAGIKEKPRCIAAPGLSTFVFGCLSFLLQMATKLEAHGGQQFVGEISFAA
jgi:hypothetical protein